MPRPPEPQRVLKTEDVAYWYFRLNGFFQIENFVVHPSRRGSQRTDADLLAVRFPHRAERLIDDPDDIMQDDVAGIGLEDDLVDILIVEIKASRCALNGPWTEDERENVHRVLAAIGCFPPHLIHEAAHAIYREGVYRKPPLRVRLIAVGRYRDDELLERFPEVKQLVWEEMLSFIWDRFNKYRRQKTQVQQWNHTGRRLRMLASSSERDEFIAQALGSLVG